MGGPVNIPSQRPRVSAGGADARVSERQLDTRMTMKITSAGMPASLEIWV